MTEPDPMVGAAVPRWSGSISAPLSTVTELDLARAAARDETDV